MLPLNAELEVLIDRALAEDLVLGDPTTDLLVPPDYKAMATLVAKAEGILAGLDVCFRVFRRVAPDLETEALPDPETEAPLADGAHLKPGTAIGRIAGKAIHILRAERVALNFLQHLSGIATETARYVKAVEGLPTRIIDTRKTTPGLRALEKYAVTLGGGRNHRQNLGDGILIKDNHIAALAAQGLSLGDVVRRALQQAPHTLKVEVEVESLEQVPEALEAGAHILLLDNMPIATMCQAVELCRGRAVTEASGGINLETVRAVAETGVDLISVGALTHSPRALDISLDMAGLCPDP